METRLQLSRCESAPPWRSSGCGAREPELTRVPSASQKAFAESLRAVRRFWVSLLRGLTGCRGGPKRGWLSSSARFSRPCSPPPPLPRRGDLRVPSFTARNLPYSARRGRLASACTAATPPSQRGALLRAATSAVTSNVPGRVTLNSQSAQSSGFVQKTDIVALLPAVSYWELAAVHPGFAGGQLTQPSCSELRPARSNSKGLSPAEQSWTKQGRARRQNRKGQPFRTLCMASCFFAGLVSRYARCAVFLRPGTRSCRPPAS